MKKYLSIEESRFHDRLEVNYAVDHKSEEVKIPRYLLQALVENALVHGASKSMGKCKILIKTEFNNGHLELSVENDGTRIHDYKSEDPKGIGLKNVKERIALYFDGKAQIATERPEPGMFVSRIRIPKSILK